MQRLVYILLLLLLPIQIMGKRDSLLWVGIKNAGIVFQQGTYDSVLVQAQRLLIIAESQEDVLAESQLHSLMGFCYQEQGDQRQAMQEFDQSVTIGETHQFLQKAKKAKHHLYHTIMLPAYSQLSTYYYKKNLEKGVKYAKSGIAWIAPCEDARLRVSSMSCFSEVLMAHKDYMLLYEPMKQAVADAIRQNQVDIALQMTAYLVQIERQIFHRSPSDIPWIKAGKELLSVAKTEHPKTLFLSAVSSADKGEATENTVKKTEKADTVPEQAIQESRMRQDSIQTRIQYIHVRNQRIVVVGVILLLLLVIFFGYILWLRHLRKRKEKESERQLKESYLEGIEQERSRLARELHDGVSNQLLAVEMKLNADGLTEQTMRLLNESREQVRRFSHELMPPEFELATLDEIVEQYVFQMNGVHGKHIVYESSENVDWSTIPHEKAYELYRMVQEAVTNVLKHSEATVVLVKMTMETGHLHVSVSDNGHGETSSSGKGIGLRTMQQRAEAIGAVLRNEHTERGGIILIDLETSSL